MTDTTTARIEDHLRSIADSLATIAATLTAPTARTADLGDPNRCDPGCVRPSLHGGDCETLPDALDDMLMAELAPRSCGAPKPGYHCTRGAHDIETPHTWTPNEEPGADPLDESDHRPRHFDDGEHLYWAESCGRWHTTVTNRHLPCSCGEYPEIRTLAWWNDEPLTFCDCEEPRHGE